MCGSELHALPEGVQRVARALQDASHPPFPVMLDGSARTAQEAADGLGVQLGQIAKSVIFKRKVRATPDALATAANVNAPLPESDSTVPSALDAGGVNDTTRALQV